MVRALSLAVLMVAFGYAYSYYCYDSSTGNDWYCDSSRYVGCCYDYYLCCLVYVNYGATYWYAWFLLSLLFFVCVCSCIGCGTYGYRRRYYVRHVNVAQPAAPVVVTSTTAGYQQVGGQAYAPPQQYGGAYKNPPPYN